MNIWLWLSSPIQQHKWVQSFMVVLRGGHVLVKDSDGLRIKLLLSLSVLVHDT